MDNKDLIIQALQEQIKILTARIADLERRLGLNSNNSSKPPSSDGFAKRPPQSLRPKGKKKSGGQLGHKGETLKQISTPDHIERHSLASCPSCQSDLKSVPVHSIQRRQVFDIPKPQVAVTEHQAEVKICPCGQRCVGIFPVNVTAPVQYGNRVKTLCVYLNHQQMIPEDRVVEVFEDVFALNISSATVVGVGEQLATVLQPWQQDVESQLTSASVKNLDETGLRIEKKTQWLHVMGNQDATSYRVSSKRGEMFSGLMGTIVHDCFKSYYLVMDVLHGLCNAHILRELKALIEFEKETWAAMMSRLLCFAKRHPEKKELLLILYDRIVQKGIDYHESLEPLKKGKRGRQKKRVGHNLLLRLKERKDDVLRFLSDPHVPFTNNLAEQDLRMMKVKMKISGGFRTMQGAKTFCTIRSFTSTCRKQGINIFQAIAQANIGFFPEISVGQN